MVGSGVSNVHSLINPVLKSMHLKYSAYGSLASRSDRGWFCVNFRTFATNKMDDVSPRIYACACVAPHHRPLRSALVRHQLALYRSCSLCAVARSYMRALWSQWKCKLWQIVKFHLRLAIRHSPRVMYTL